MALVEKIKAEINRFLDRKLIPETLAAQEFPEVNVRFAENQDEYLTLPALNKNLAYPSELDPIQRGAVTHWGFSWKDRIRILFGKGLYLEQITFGNALQPVMLSTDRRHHIPDNHEELTDLVDSAK